MGRKRKQVRDDGYWRSAGLMTVVLAGLLLQTTPQGQVIIALSIRLVKFAVLGVIGWFIWAYATDPRDN